MEKIIIKVIVDGEELKPVEMADGVQSYFYEDEIQFHWQGHLFDKAGKKATHFGSINITRNKTAEEKVSPHADKPKPIRKENKS